jgi:ABC-type transporter Mla subunit MlaD
MKPASTLIIGALVVVLAIVGYLYYQRTRNDITIQLPKIGSIMDRNDIWHVA